MTAATFEASSDDRQSTTSPLYQSVRENAARAEGQKPRPGDEREEEEVDEAYGWGV